MGLAAGIIMIFIIMVAFFISYGKAFKIKNEMINAIEQSEGMDFDDLQDFVVGKSTSYVGREIGVCYSRIEKGSKFLGFTMNVVVYMEMDRTILGDAFHVRIPITGETKMIEKGIIYNELAKGSSHTISGISLCSTGYKNVQNS